jgi:transcriptional regulator with XRE-family HTH domain
MNLGSQLRKKRKAGGYTLRHISEKAKVSEGFLSQVENNVKSPSIETLMNICAALDVNPGDLLNALKNEETLFVIRQEEWEDTDVPPVGIATRRFLPPEDRSVIDSAVLFIQPSHLISARKEPKNAQEILCVLRGVLELSHGDRKVTLHPGDAAHFFSRTDGQNIVNPGPGLTVALWIGTL